MSGALPATATAPAQRAPLRVLHVVPGMTRGGAERALLRLVLDTRAVLEHSIVSLADSDTMVAEFAAAGAPVTLLGARRGRPTPRDLLRLRGLITAARPDLINAWMYHAAAACATLAPRSVPMIWSIRAGLEMLQTAPLSARIAVRASRALSRRPDAIIYNSHAAQAQHRGFGFREHADLVLHNGIELPNAADVATLRAQTRTALGVAPDEVLFAIIGRPHAVKGHGDFATAAALVRQARPAARFLRLGRDPVQRDRNPGTAALLATEWVLHVDEQPDPTPWIAAADVIVSASWSESCPNVVQEAMAAGRPVVATDVGDSALLVGATGWIVPARAPQALAAAMIEAVDVGAKGRAARGAQARADAAIRFTRERVAEAHLALYESLCAASATRGAER